MKKLCVIVNDVPLIVYCFMYLQYGVIKVAVWMIILLLYKNSFHFFKLKIIALLLSINAQRRAVVVYVTAILFIKREKIKLNQTIK